MPYVAACSTLGFADYTLDEAAGAIAEIGFTEISIAHMSSYCRHYDHRKDKPADVLALLSCYGLTVSSMNQSVRRPEVHDSYRVTRPEHARAYGDHVRELIDHAAQLRVRDLVVSIGHRTNTPQDAGERAVFAAILSELADYAADQGVRLSVELPHVYSVAHDVATTIDFFNHVPSEKLITTFDSSHWLVSKYDENEFFARLGNRIHHVHLRDARGTDTADFQQELELTPGNGEVDFRLMGILLDQHNYGDRVVLEMEHRNGSSMDGIRQEYAFGIRHLKSQGWTFPEGV